LERSNAELEEFAYVASHDLQEPLRAIEGCAQLLRERYLDKLGSLGDKLITHTVEGVVRMQALIDDLLTFSRLETRGNLFEHTDCSAVLELVLSNLSAAVEKTKAVITHDAMPNILADETQLIQLFQNLISNALKFCGDRNPRIHIAAISKRNEWFFSVQDNGIGIDPQHFERIFHVFQRLHTRREYPGTGIGLAVCKKIVQRHGGRIWVESEPTKGSIFYFTIPKHPDSGQMKFEF
jgi:light-regulated signal transduction histidine kinase (bacteriophytochrome)